MNKQDLLERLRNTNEISLMEMLGITSNDLVDAFLDIIEEKYDYLDKETEENS